ncbi:hypothetical protein EJ08DRAFT_47853 [Tothia fuscella]|uniref:Uncharacterized protein n=1 Tax=Tothia fuscella TaxID=1048955 RepID=A0A9P4TT89_9PEZI|nr:hypothetical protein EJ08DRAFT_47853 [Tothia fuscella]
MMRHFIHKRSSSLPVEQAPPPPGARQPFSDTASEYGLNSLAVDEFGDLMPTPSGQRHSNQVRDYLANAPSGQHRQQPFPEDYLNLEFLDGTTDSETIQNHRSSEPLFREENHNPYRASVGNEQEQDDHMADGYEEERNSEYSQDPDAEDAAAQGDSLESPRAAKIFSAQGMPNTAKPLMIPPETRLLCSH